MSFIIYDIYVFDGVDILSLAVFELALIYALSCFFYLSLSVPPPKIPFMMFGFDLLVSTIPNSSGLDALRATLKHCMLKSVRLKSFFVDFCCYGWSCRTLSYIYIYNILSHMITGACKPLFPLLKQEVIFDQPLENQEHDEPEREPGTMKSDWAQGRGSSTIVTEIWSVAQLRVPMHQCIVSVD